MVDADDIRSGLMDVAKDVQELADHVSSGECCETDDDLKTNVEEALRSAQAVVAQLKKLSRGVAT